MSDVSASQRDKYALKLSWSVLQEYVSSHCRSYMISDALEKGDRNVVVALRSPFVRVVQILPPPV
jgi:hypothetical protein